MGSDMNRLAFGPYRWAVLATALCCFASPAAAQYKPRSLNDPATGEKYHIEAGADYWFPTADAIVASEQLGLKGTPIDFKNTLGLTDQKFPMLQLTLRLQMRAYR